MGGDGYRRLVGVSDQVFALGATILSVCLMREVGFESEMVGIKVEGEDKMI
jgi:hypothetical protein